MNAVCLLCRKPDRIWCEFLNDFKNYKVFLMIDDCSIDLTELKKDYSNLEFVQIEDESCVVHNYTKINYFVKKDITAWEKALFYFHNLNNQFSNIWFIEDDVFFYDENVLFNIDKEYPEEDLLTRFSFNPKENEDKWGPISLLTLPIQSAMCCVVRMSKKMLKAIDDFVLVEKRFCFLEILFPTLATTKKLNYKNPKQLDSVLFNPDKKIRHKVFTDLLYTNLFHPVKDIYKHKIYREGILH